MVCAGPVLGDSPSERELLSYLKGRPGVGNEEKPGLIDATNEGTLFLDEVADLPWHVQGKLVRLLERQEMPRAGSGPPEVPIRVIARLSATWVY